MEEEITSFFLEGNVKPIPGTDGVDVIEIIRNPFDDPFAFLLLIDAKGDDDVVYMEYFLSGGDNEALGVIAQLGEGEDSFQSLYTDFGGVLYIDAGLGDDDIAISGFATELGSNPVAPGEPLLLITPSTAETFYLYGNEGMDTFDLDYLEAADLTVLGGDGIDRVDMKYIESNTIIVLGGADKDYITLDNITINVPLKQLDEVGIGIAGGDGDDEIMVDNVTIELEDGGVALVERAAVEEDDAPLGVIEVERKAVVIEPFVQIAGEDGDDMIGGSNESDLITGNDGSDNIDGGGGTDIIYGGDLPIIVEQELRAVVVDPPVILVDNDIINGGADGDVIFGGLGTNTIYGDGEGLRGDEVDEDGNPLLAQGADSITGGDLDDIIFGNGGNDSIMGGDGADWLQGNQGADVVDGGLGDDLLVAGGNDNDLVDGGAGSDTVKGGPGDDTLIFKASEHSAGDVDIYYGDRGTLSNAKGDDGVNDTLQIQLDATLLNEEFETQAEIEAYKLGLEEALNESLAFSNNSLLLDPSNTFGLSSELEAHEIEQVLIS